MSIGWNFPLSNGGSDDGFNDAGIETFAGARFDGLAREIIQNSLDAMDGDQQPVTVEFDFVHISREDFLGADELLESMEKCLQESTDDKGKSFFKEAINQLQKEKIPCLKISDSGTTGLRGDYRKRQGQWYAITKARGRSDKSDSTAGGSFGIGKNAPFTVSALRTVFYATHYKDDNTSVYRAQGKSILMSHSEGSDYTQATGFYGQKEGCMPIEDSIPAILRPTEQGCVVFIPGFVTGTNWQYEIMATVLSNFFYAIEQGKLEVLIQDESRDIKVIDRDHLNECFQKVIDLKIDDKVKWSHDYYRIMQSPDSVEKETELGLLGHCKMWVLVEEGLPKRTALLRKTGMLITDEQSGLKRWTGRTDFAGVFVCDSDKGNRILRNMENPQHNAFEPDRAIPEQRDECKKALKELVSWVRASVDDLAKPPETEQSQIDELSEFFPDVDADENIPGDDGERDIEGRTVYTPKPLKRMKPKDGNIENGDGDDGGGGGNGGGGGGNGGGGGSDGSKSTTSVEIKNVRVVADATDDKKKTVHFTPTKDGDTNIVLAIARDDGTTERIKVTAAIGLKNGIVMLNTKQGQRVSLKVTLAESVSDSIAVLASQKKPASIKNETSSK